MKRNERLGLRINETVKTQLQNIASRKGIDISDIVNDFIIEGLRKSGDALLLDANNIIDRIADSIQLFQNNRDYVRELTKDEEQFLKALEFCYDLLARTNFLLNDSRNTVPDPENENEVTYKHAISENKIADEILSLH